MKYSKFYMPKNSVKFVPAEEVCHVCRKDYTRKISFQKKCLNCSNLSGTVRDSLKNYVKKIVDSITIK